MMNAQSATLCLLGKEQGRTGRTVGKLVKMALECGLRGSTTCSSSVAWHGSYVCIQVVCV